jgi:hypothetical protein
MTRSTFNLRTLTQDAFSPPQEPKPFILPEVAEQDGQFVQMRQTLAAADVLGRPYFLPVRLGGVLLPNEPVMIIRGRKHIVETDLVGSKRRGSVKELIRLDDYDVTIRGIAIQTANTRDYPEDQVKALHDLYLRNEALSVESGLTELLGIYRLVVREIGFPELRGFQHAQAYELLCRSDEDFILEIPA